MALGITLMGGGLVIEPFAYQGAGVTGAGLVLLATALVRFIREDHAAQGGH
jgi:hypothetical protein